MNKGAGEQGSRGAKKKPLGPALHWNEVELDARSEISQTEIEAVRLFLKRRGLKRAARLLEAIRAVTPLPLE